MEAWASPPARRRSLLSYFYRAFLSLSAGARLRRRSEYHLPPSLHRSSSLSSPLFHPCLRRFSSFTSSSSCSSDRCHAVSYFVSETVGGLNKDRLAPLYHRAALIRPPPTVSVRRVPRNYCSFIGSVTFNPRLFRSPLLHDRFRVYTVLQVDTTTGSSFPAAERPPDTQNDPPLPFRILLVMSDDLAKAASEHLRRDDFIYVCGQLASYRKPDGGGNWHLNHKLYVKDLNFVARNIGSRTGKNLHEDDRTINCYGEIDGGNDRESESRERIHLWQVFFSNPFEWWDNRNCKRYPGEPDFRHKDTKECLTLRPDDPPWIKKQLEKCDSEGIDRDDDDIYYRVSEWKLD